MLADRDSSELHLNLARRHQRLARRYQQTNLVIAIQPAIDALAARQSAATEMDLERQATYDSLLAADGDLDDAIRNAFAATEAFDRDHLGAGTLPMLFPSGGFGTIVDLPLAEEPATAEALATKIETLGAAHALFPHAAKLKTLAQSVRGALVALDDAVRAAKNADAEEEIAQNTLRRQYEHNYLTSRQNIGRSITERLFPRANRAQPSEAKPIPAGPTTP